jgi:phosphatidylglycerophosphate synthase
MIDSYFRTTYQKYFINPILYLTERFPISPNTITLLSLGSGLCTLPLLYYQAGGLAAGFLLLSGYFDTLDGSVARKELSSSSKGAVLDIMSDRTVESTVLIGLYLQDPSSRGFFCLLMACSILLCVTSFLVVGIFEKNTTQKSFYYSPGIMERTEAFAFFLSMILLPGWFAYLAVLFSLLVLMTALIRIKEFG